jgi:hypothetical protein
MSGPEWDQIKSVPADALEAGPTAPPALLDRLCGIDTELRCTLDSFLVLQTQPHALFDTQKGLSPFPPRLL